MTDDAVGLATVDLDAERRHRKLLYVTLGLNAARAFMAMVWTRKAAKVLGRPLTRRKAFVVACAVQYVTAHPSQEAVQKAAFNVIELVRNTRAAYTAAKARGG